MLRCDPCMYYAYQLAQSDQSATTAGGIPSLSAWLLGLQGRIRPCAARWTQAWATLTARLGTFEMGDGSEKCVHTADTPGMVHAPCRSLFSIMMGW
jgi:hypothetical protein